MKRFILFIFVGCFIGYLSAKEALDNKQSITVTGTVIDATNDVPFIGATVEVKDSREGVCTDFEGHFSIEAYQGSTLAISSRGCDNNESKRDMNDAENKLDTIAISRIEDMLTNLKREMISLKYVSSHVEPLPIGATKYGGQPDVPDGFEWPIDKNGRPLSLLLQINCADIAALDKENLLPKSGMLYFFYQVSEQPWDNTTNGARVLYFNASIAKLHKKNYPNNLTEEETITERALQFKVDISYPSFDDLLGLSQDSQYLIDHWDEYSAAFERLAEDYLNDEAGIGFMLGYAELIQSSIVDNLENNVLLLQLDSDEENEDGVMFGDCGSIYYYIPKQDLFDRRFDRLTFELQCY